MLTMRLTPREAAQPDPKVAPIHLNATIRCLVELAVLPKSNVVIAKHRWFLSTVAPPISRQLSNP
jgi:hypothetical protein